MKQEGLVSNYTTTQLVKEAFQSVEENLRDIRLFHKDRGLAFLAFLPRIWGMTGVWFAVPAAEFLTMFVSFLFLKINQ